MILRRQEVRRTWPGVVLAVGAISACSADDARDWNERSSSDVQAQMADAAVAQASCEKTFDGSFAAIQELIDPVVRAAAEVK